MYFLNSNNHDDDHVIERTDLPDELVTKVGGNKLFEHEAPLVNRTLERELLGGVNELLEKGGTFYTKLSHFSWGNLKRFKSELIYNQLNMKCGIKTCFELCSHFNNCPILSMVKFPNLLRKIVKSTGFFLQCTVSSGHITS